MKRIVKTSQPAVDIPARQTWKTFNDAYLAWSQKPLNRRRFLQRMSALSAGLLVPSFIPDASLLAATKKQQAEPWPTLAAVQQHLFPTEKHSPGAHEINALGYLQTVINDPGFDAEERNFILNGPKWLNELAEQQYQTLFESLKFEQAEYLLKQVSQTRAGENWLSTLLLYIFEALLSSPVYGGNLDGIGWTWLEHDPGFPQPGTNQTWMQLKKKL